MTSTFPRLCALRKFTEKELPKRSIVSKAHLLPQASYSSYILTIQKISMCESEIMANT